MAREPFNRIWTENPIADDFDPPTDAMWQNGWRGGPEQEPPEAFAQNWWQNRVDSALQDLERFGAMRWNDEAIYSIGAYAEGADGIIYRSMKEDNTGVNPVGDASGNWQSLSDYIVNVVQSSGLFVPSNRIITSGSGLSGGGNLSANRELSVDNTVVRTTRSISAGDGLQGGGTLSANRTLAVDSTVVRTSQMTSSMFTSGWARNSVSGLIIQWANTNSVAPNENANLAFPIPFPRECFRVIPTMSNASTTSDDVFARVIEFNRTTARLRAELTPGGVTAGTRFIDYIAVGY